MATKDMLEVFPANNPSDGQFSREKGSTIITLPIAATEGYLKGDSLRLQGQFKIVRKTAAGVDTACDNSYLPAGGAPAVATGGGLQNPNNSVFIDPVASLYSCFSQLTLSSKSSATQIEQINNYNRLMASLLRVYQSDEDMNSDKANVYYGGNNTPLVNLGLGIHDPATTAAAQANQISFSMRLYSGLLMGDVNNSGLIPLSNTWGIGGLNVNLLMEAPTNVLYSLGNTGASAGGGAYYVLSNLRLVGEIIRPSPKRLLSLQSDRSHTFGYRTFSSLYNVINSSNHSATFDLGLGNVVSCFMNLVPTRYINDYKENGQACVRLVNSNTANQYDGSQVNIKNLMFTRNSIKFPNDYLTSKKDTESGYVHSEILRDYLTAIRPFTEIDHTIQDTRVANEETLRSNNGVAQDPTLVYMKDKLRGGGGSYGLGISYDSLRESDERSGGADFKNQQWGFTIESDLGTSTGGDAPHSAYIFFLAKNQVAINNGRIQVVE